MTTIDIPTNVLKYCSLFIFRNFDAFLHLLNGNIGTGILSIPYVIKEAGLWLGIIGLFIVSFCCVTSMRILVGCSHRLQQGRQVPLNYAQVTEFALVTSGSPFKFQACIICQVKCGGNNFPSNRRVQIHFRFRSKNQNKAILHYNPNS